MRRILATTLMDFLAKCQGIRSIVLSQVSKILTKELIKRRAVLNWTTLKQIPKSPSYGVDMVAMDGGVVDTGDEDVTVDMVATEDVGDMDATGAMETMVDVTGAANLSH
ncbi:hypothetical protein K493DRAFT_299884 [Basidiobolus meristosporus CBS 931.73]|uniref:Uncharacterized protein n=1 Tax=Basidiobolus meristosporus CBS 931.73 TaxID=1314790 RepID=A0A1Y1YKJ7_9FUNG|nr:hypothetical protein K493DRAFT_299884 [Basidiobolus meristosporus CBS 931.73]|eukprot:ORX98519.1 hypothetical protein K493DRAFT_299884 [Basidiobolus meristosporus CBS 931.73]